MRHALPPIRYAIVAAVEVVHCQLPMRRISARLEALIPFARVLVGFRPRAQVTLFSPLFLLLFEVNTRGDTPSIENLLDSRTHDDGVKGGLVRHLLRIESSYRRELR